MQQPIYNSRSLVFKRPFGAVETGTQVQFTVHLPIEWVFSSVTLIIYSEQYEHNVTMEYQKTKGDCLYYRASFTPVDTGVYFYLFKLQKGDQIRYIKSLEDASGVINNGESGRDYQLTVYKPGYTTPSSIKGGILYQIFPDRFCRSGVEHPNVPQDRELRSDWGGLPYFLPNEQGEITNSDYFGGDLLGIQKKLPYLQQLGVTMIYLNPIFEAHSNHRYNTADYRKIDPLLGTEEDFINLCREAKKRGIRIILDGVFSHTGSDSIYFNKNSRYNSAGAFNTPESPYKNWFQFLKYPDVYKSWWGFTSLPELDKNNPDYINFICGEDGILRHWLRLGASGYRLDVADELPDSFIARVREAVKAEGEENLLIGEVWEDASNKLAYGVRRKYFLGDELDSVMNYPFKEAILDLLRGGHRSHFINRISDIVENYPPQSLHVAMNSLSTHDTERAITVLAGLSCQGKDRGWQSHHHLNFEQYRHGVELLKAAMALQYFLPGLPCIYYGDEAGLQGYKDPFNRGCYPWGCENRELIDYVCLLGKLRLASPALGEGALEFLDSEEGLIALKRKDYTGETIAIINYTNVSHNFSHNLKGYNCLYRPQQSHQLEIGPYGLAVYIRKNENNE